MLEEFLNPYSPFFWILIISILLFVIIIISRPFLTYIKFVYPNAKFEAIGNPFIQEKNLNSIVESKDLNSFKETLNSLKDYNIVGEDTSSIQNSIDKNFIQSIEMMRKDCSPKLNDFFNTYLEKIDIYLIKNEIKRIIFDISYSTDIEQAILPNTKELLFKLKDANKENALEILNSYNYDENIINSISVEKPDILQIDIAFDRYIINKLKNINVPYKCEQARQSYIKYMMDLLNIKNVLRASQFGYNIESRKSLFFGEGQEIAEWKYNELSELQQPSQMIMSLEGTSYFNVLKDAIEEYNKENSVQVFENVLDSYLLKIVRDISLQNYLNLGPTIRFLVSKEFETRNLKTISKAIGENLSSNIFKKFLIKEVSS